MRNRKMEKAVLSVIRDHYKPGTFISGEFTFALAVQHMTQLLAHIDELEKELGKFRKDRKNARDCTATYWMNYGEKVAQCHIDAEDKLRAYEEAVEPIVKEFGNEWASELPDSAKVTYVLDDSLESFMTLGDIRRLVEIMEGK